MKVLLVSVKSEKSKGGIAVWTNHYLTGCSQTGLECDLINTEAIGKFAVDGTSKRSIKDEVIRSYRINKQLKGYLNLIKYDVAHLNTSIGIAGIIRDYYVARKIVKEKIPLVLHFHCDISYCIRNPLLKYYLKKALKLSNRNFVLCENSYQYLKQEFQTESFIIPNFVNEKLIIDSKNIEQTLKKICFVGRVTLAKGAKEIFKIARVFPDIQFKLAGAVSEDVALWDKPVNVELAGIVSHDETIKILDESDLFIFPSHTEGFSLALTESMARGVPAIATDVGANISMLEDHGGIIVKVGDVEAIKKAIEKMKDPYIRRNMSEWCINKVKENYTVTYVMNEILHHYKKIIRS